ncbi:MAG: hypothetical protein AAF267_17610, partial [Deinococcota bacterium]
PIPARRRSRLEGVQNVAIKQEGLPPFEQACEYIKDKDDITARELLEVGIASSKTKGKELMAQLKKAGFLGKFDKSRRTTPVVKKWS